MKPDLLDRFVRYSESMGLFVPGERIVTGLSGGSDSLALVDLFSRVGQPLVLAHCNFMLRGEESDADTAFVRQVAVVYDYPLQVKRFDTAAYAREMGISTEMAARDLRYAWFEELMQAEGAGSVAVAHHSDDSAETLLINLVRGTGLRGLTGMKARQGNVIRPMLFADREDITRYLKFRNLEYRTDSSNADLRYIRNRIRHVIIPELEKINPSVRSTLKEETGYLAEASGIVDAYVGRMAEEVSRREGDRLLIDTGALLEKEFAGTILFGLLRPYGFHGRQIPRILAAAQSRSGRQFRSGEFLLFIDRKEMVLTTVTGPTAERYYYDPEHPDEELPVRMTSRLINDVTHYPPRDPWIACLDYEKLDLPLVLRRWEKGDFFYPLGMNHAKKVSDFFIDQKVSRIDKEQAWILASGEQIVWIPGHRIDQRFRVTPKTRYILEIKMVQ